MRRHRQRGFTLVEVLLVTAFLSLIVGAYAGIVVYSHNSRAIAGDRLRANQLAEEGIEAVRSIRAGGYTSLADGTYGLAQNDNVWVLSGNSDINGMYTRQVAINSNGSNRKDITATVTWLSGGSIHATSITSRLSNWSAAVAEPKTWSNAIKGAAYNVAGTEDGAKVQTSGNYAYVVRSSGRPNFLVLDISKPAAPTLVGSMNLEGVPTNLHLSNNYVYVTNELDKAELQIINVATPATPTLAGSYDASGSANGQSVFAVGATAYLVRAAEKTSHEFMIVDVTAPASPALLGSYNNNISMTDVYISGQYAYVGTNSPTAELLHINIAVPVLPNLASFTNLAANGIVSDLKVVNDHLLVAQGPSLSIMKLTPKTAMARQGLVTLSGTASINDIATDVTATYAFLAAANSSHEFQVVTLSKPGSARVVRRVGLFGGPTGNLNGIAYNSTSDIVVGAGALDYQEAITFVKN